MPPLHAESVIRSCQPILPLVLLALAGCEASHRLVGYPPGALPVEFEPSTSYSTCLVASVTMAANYVEDRPRFKVKDVVAELKAAGADETKVQSLKEYMATRGFDVWSLAGEMSENPSTGLLFWLRRQRYPVVCVINRLGESSDFNHAVVVIGIGEHRGVESADKIYYLDPSADSPLYTCSAEEFENMWARCLHTMLVVTKSADRAGKRMNTG